MTTKSEAPRTAALPTDAFPLTQHWDPDRYAQNASFVAAMAMPLVDMLDPQPGERVLDLGCGNGTLALAIAARGAQVLAIDSSPDQVAAARAAGLDAQLGDGAKLAFDRAFDAVFSNAALHWILDPELVIDGMWRALKPGGRLVAEMGGSGNVAQIVAALIAALNRRGQDGRAAMPWYFPTPAEQRGRLEARGFMVDTMDLIDRPTALPGEMADWLATFGEPFIKRLHPADRRAMVDEVCAALAPNLRDADGRWTADYVRLRFTAHKPA